VVFLSFLPTIPDNAVPYVITIFPDYSLPPNQKTYAQPNIWGTVTPFSFLV